MTKQRDNIPIRLIVAMLFTFIAISPLTGARADLLAKIRSDGKIRVAIAGATPPFSYMDSENRLVGSDVDTARLLAADLGVKLDIVRINNADRITVLQEKRADLVISTLSITPERERQIAFSVPYAQILVVIAASQPHRFASILDLNGKTVGVLANSSNYTQLVHDAPGTSVMSYVENDKLLSGYAAGEFDIISTPESVVNVYNQTKPKRPLFVQFTQSEFNIAVGIPSGEKPLRDWTNTWVVSNLRNDKLSDIYLKHHGHRLSQSILPSTEMGKK